MVCFSCHSTVRKIHVHAPRTKLSLYIYIKITKISSKKNSISSIVKENLNMKNP